jgi:hypothetical protein
MYQAKADGRNTIRFLDTEANSLKKSRKKNA